LLIRRITFGVTVSEQITTPHVIPNTVFVDDGLGNILELPATVVANGLAVYMSLVMR